MNITVFCVSIEIDHQSQDYNNYIKIPWNVCNFVVVNGPPEGLNQGLGPSANQVSYLGGSFIRFRRIVYSRARNTSLN